MLSMRLVGLIAALAIIFAAGCVEKDNGSTSSAQNALMLRVTGSTTALPLVAQVAESFNEIDKNIQASVSGGGSGAGIKDLGEGRSALAMMSRDVTDEERKLYETPTEKLKEIPIGYDAIIIAVSPQVYESGVTALTHEQVKKIYSREINNWKGVGGFDKQIYVIGRKAGSGTRDTFNELVMGNKSAETPGVTTEAEGNAEVKTAIIGSTTAIGYIGIGFIGGSTRAVTLDGVDANAETIKSGKYELARKLYLVTLGNPSPETQQFIDFVLGTEGQKIALDNGFVPL